MRLFIISTILLFYCLLLGTIKRVIILKYSIEGVDYNLIKNMSWFDFGIGFLYPVIIFGFYLLTFRISTLIFATDTSIENNIDFAAIIIYSLLPIILFSFINLYFINEINSKDLVYINQTGKGGIIPYLSIHATKIITNVLLMIPSFVMTIILNVKYKVNLLNSILSSFIPIILIIIFYSIL